MTTQKISAVLAVVLATLLSACSSPGTRVVLLPQEDGKSSAVVVRTIGAGDVLSSEQTLSAPYQRATTRVGASEAPAIDQADPAKIKADNASLFSMVPPKPVRYTLYFEGGGTALTAESQQTMVEALASAVARSGGDIVITGHTDTTGSLEQNDDLSRRRAQLVRQMFIDRQFPAQRIEAVGRGKRELAVPTADEVNEPLNRRVTIEVR